MSIKQSLFKTNMSLKVAVILGLGFVSVFAMAPSKVGVSLADNSPTNCTNSTTPVFNPYPISNTPGGCNDYAFMRAQVDSANGSQSGFTAGSVQAQPGDKVEVVMYIDNGAALNSASLTGL